MSPRHLVTPSSDCRDLLIDGGFEAGPFSPAWVRLGPYELIIGDRPHAGEYGAWLGGYHEAEDMLYQTVLVPSGAVTATLGLWWTVSSAERDHPHDYLNIQLRDPSGDLLATLLTLTDADRGRAWHHADLDVTAYAGHAVRVTFQVLTDANAVTDFYVDDVSLSACSPPPWPPGQTRRFGLP